MQTRKQFFRGEKWFVVIDPLNNNFFRITPGAHEFLCRLGHGATVDEVWHQCLKRDPDGAPGQNEVIRLLSQLHLANLLRGDIPPDSTQLLERYSKRRRKEFRSFFSLVSLRFPLLDPDRFLVRTLPFVRWLFGPVGLILWLAVVGGAIKVAMDHFDSLQSQTEGILAPGNLVLLFLCTIVIKGIHEFGHAFACRAMGGEVHQMGVMLIYFSPLPYVDATSSWAFRNKWKRILVASAGMIVELFIAALAVYIWAATGTGTLHSIAYNVIIVASVTTVLFNINPLLRFDGYYILGDILEMPNMQMRATQALKNLCELYLFKCAPGPEVAKTRGELIFLISYGILSWAYRLVLVWGITLYVSTQFLLLGVIMAFGCIYSMTILPLWKLAAYLHSSPQLSRRRTRAVLVTAGLFSFILGFLLLIPMPNRFRAPGILQADEYSKVFTQTPGNLVEIIVPSGKVVRKGEPLLRFESKELELELAATEAELARAIAQEEQALEKNAAGLGPMRSRRVATEKHLGKLKEQQKGLLITAGHDGTWVSPRIEDNKAQWFPRGQLLGQLLEDSQFRFTAVISQQEAASLFTDHVRGSQVRIVGQPNVTIEVDSLNVIPAQQELLPSSALAWEAGGEIATSSKDPARAAESFYELRAALRPNQRAQFLHGRSGKIRLDLDPEPLLFQGYRKLRQLLQRNYQV